MAGAGAGAVVLVVVEVLEGPAPVDPVEPDAAPDGTL